eukprot:5554147-Pyramimonas_sp.AAC.1
MAQQCRILVRGSRPRRELRALQRGSFRPHGAAAKSWRSAGESAPGGGRVRRSAALAVASSALSACS